MIKWIMFDDEFPSNDVERVLVYTPENPAMEYRIMPLFVAIKQNQEFTHWAYLTRPKQFNNDI
tara:strand:+ start:2798 stop:2986 length:189 start_codon:yes stop_codon:yes gene_type:complete